MLEAKPHGYRETRLLVKAGTTDVVLTMVGAQEVRSPRHNLSRASVKPLSSTCSTLVGMGYGIMAYAIDFDEIRKAVGSRSQEAFEAYHYPIRDWRAP